MVSREMIEIILKAEDQASRVMKENEQNMKKLGETAKQSSQKANQANQQYSKSLEYTKKQLSNTISNVQKVGNKGAESFRKLTDVEQDAVTKFRMLDKEAQETLNTLHEYGTGWTKFMPGAEKAIQDLNNMDAKVHTLGGAIDYSRARMELMGQSTSGIIPKLQYVGNGINTYIGLKWDSMKNKVSSFGGFIKSNLSSALTTVRSKLDSLGSAFSGFGGVISSAIGGLGMASISEMTIGLSMNRDRVKSLTDATLGASKATDDYFNRMDKLTNESLVGLDELSQAMSTIKMSTGMSNKELESMTDVVNDIGQRAIMMGKDSNESLSLMQAAGKGLNGEFQMLQDNFGISKKKLEKLGWSGAADDVDGYRKALEQALDEGGDMAGMMDTTSGHLETLKKKFRVAGRHVGDMFTPYIDQAVVGLTNLQEKCPGLFEGLVGIAGGISMFATLAPSITPALQAFDMLSDKTKSLLVFTGLMTGAEDALTISTLGNTVAEYANAVAKDTQAAATVAAMTANEGFLSSVLALNVALLANPITWVVVALIALAAAVYEVGKYFGWWKDIPTLFQAITNNVGRLWDAFIHNPDVQGIISAIGQAWKWLQEVTKPVVDWLRGIWVQIFPESAQGQWDVTRAIIDAIGIAFQALTMPIRSLIAILQILYPYMQQFYTNVLVPLGEFLTTVFTPVWQLLCNILTMVIPYVNSLSSAFTAFANGQMSLPDLIRNVLTNLWGIYTTMLSMIVNAVISWAGKLFSQGVNAASRFVMGIINKILSLPGKFGIYLLQVVSRIASAGSQWITQGVSKASAMVSGIISNVSQLPGKVYTEFMNIGSRIMQAGSDLVNKAKKIGENIVNGLLNAMGIHSPGIIQESVVTEFTNMVTRVASKIKGAYDTAKSMGNAIVEGFGNPSLEVDTTNMLPNEDALKTSIGVQSATASIDTTGINVSNSDVAGSFDNMALQTGNALQTMVEQDKNAYDTIRNNDASQLASISGNLQSKMSNMTNNVRTSMNTMVAKNKTGMINAKKTTQTQLNSMVSKTKSANSEMIASWGVMKNGIVKAADKIKSDSTTHFNNLSKTIGGFYGKLKNPSRWGAGTPNLKSRGTSTKGFGKITNAIRNASLPSYLTLSQIRSNPLIDTSKFGDYVTRDPKQNRFKVSDLLRYGILEVIGKGAGDYDSIPSPNIKVIKDTSNEWGMKGPLVGKYSTSKGFKVKEFLTGVPKITFSAFKSIAEEVFGQTQYEFYYDNDHHGNWINAFNAGSMNCYHGAQALIALANTMGLSGNLVHGHWNKYGHFWANIAGHKMDVTGWQNQRNWTPAASHAGPAPKSRNFSFADMINELKSAMQNENNDAIVYDSTNSEIVINGEVKVVHDFLNLPENITASELARLINDLPEDENWIKKLVKNVIFQKWDLKEKARLERKANRAKGV